MAEEFLGFVWREVQAHLARGEKVLKLFDRGSI